MSAAPKPASTRQTLADLRARAQGRKLAAAAAPGVSESVFRAVTRESPILVRFQMNPTIVGYANTLRRTMITDVETVAFRADISETGTIVSALSLFM